MKQDFYVYVHSRPSTGEPFYVGKGRGSRATVGGVRGRRNAWWRRVVAKEGGYHVSFVARDLDDELAQLLEIELIASYRRAGAELCNLTEGGEGGAGYRFTDEQRAAQSRRLQGNKNRLGTTHTDATKAKFATRPPPSAEQRQRISWVQSTRERGPLSESQRAKLLAARLGRPAPNRGKPHSESAKANMRAAWARRAALGLPRRSGGY